MGASLDTIISQLDAKFKFSDSSAAAEQDEREELEKGNNKEETPGIDGKDMENEAKKDHMNEDDANTEGKGEDESGDDIEERENAESDVKTASENVSATTKDDPSGGTEWTALSEVFLIHSEKNIAFSYQHVHIDIDPVGKLNEQRI